METCKACGSILDNDGLCTNNECLFSPVIGRKDADQICPVCGADMVAGVCQNAVCGYTDNNDENMVE
jgi:hypothetical protein